MHGLLEETQMGLEASPNDHVALPVDAMDIDNAEGFEFTYSRREQATVW